MSYYAEPFTFDFTLHQINVDDGVSNVDLTDLYDAIKLARASEEGILYDEIAFGSGLVPLGDGVFVGLTVGLVGTWQLHFFEGAYIAKVAGGNLVGGPSGDPIAYSAGVQTVLQQSAASTVVSLSGSVPSAEETADAVWSRSGRGVKVDETHQVHGLNPAAPLVVTETSRTAGSIEQSIDSSGGTVTVTRE